jgi:hypothetical protein
MDWTAEVSQRPRARLTGLVYLLYFLTAIAAQIVSGKHVAYGNAANLVADALYIAMTLLLYSLLEPVNRILSGLAAVVSLAGCAIMVFGLFRPSVSLPSPLLFFGPYCLLIGYLIFRSTFLPKFVGVLMALAGVGWLVFLLPRASRLSLYIEIAGVLAEASLMLWLLLRGVNAQQWKAGDVSEQLVVSSE